MGDKITALPAATSLDGTEVSPIVQAGTTKKVSGTLLRAPIGNAGGDLVGSYPNPTLAVVTTAQSGVGSVSAIPVLSVDAKGRVTSLSSVANRMGTVTSVTAGAGLSGGTITATGSLSVVYGTTAGTAAQGNDSRFNTIPAASSTLPLADAAAAVGTGTTFARADHVHPQGTVVLSGDITGSGSGTIATTLTNITSAQTGIGSLTQIPQISIDTKGRVTALTTVPNPQTALTGLTGDITATGPGAVSAQLSASGVAAGTYGYAAHGKVPSITVDAKGRIGAASEEVIILPTDKMSVSVHNFSYTTKPFVFTAGSNTGNVPYSIGQWVTVRSTANSEWMSGVVVLSSSSGVSVTVQQLSNISAGPQTSWAIRLGQTLNYSNLSVPPAIGKVLAWDGTFWTPTTAPSGDAISLRGYPIGSGYVPNTGDGLVWSGTEWRPQTGGSSNATAIQGVGVSGLAPSSGDSLIYTGVVWQPGQASANAVKIQGRDVTDSVPDERMSLTWQGSSWQPSFTTELAGTNLQTPLSPTEGQVLAWDDTGSVWKPVAANATKIQSRDVANTLPAAGQVLAWNADNSAWEPTSGGGGGGNATSLQGDAIADVTPNALEVLTWAKEPTGTGDFEWRPRTLAGNSTPTVGQGLVYDASLGWVAGDIDAVKLTGTAVSTTDPTTNQALVYNGTDWAPAAVNAAQLQGQPVSSSAPGTGNLLKFDGTNWVPFDGIAIPNWNVAVSYSAGDRVWHDGKIWVVLSANSGNTPSTGSAYWAENIGSNSGNPGNQSTPVYWLRITTPAGDGYMPIYV